MDNSLIDLLILDLFSDIDVPFFLCCMKKIFPSNRTSQKGSYEWYKGGNENTYLLPISKTIYGLILSCRIIRSSTLVLMLFPLRISMLSL